MLSYINDPYTFILFFFKKKILEKKNDLVNILFFFTMHIWSLSGHIFQKQYRL